MASLTSTTTADQDSSSGDESDYEELDPSLRNLVEQTSLKWIFVGGKGGVGKTTSSSSIGVLLSRTRRKVLIISTDPAHNVSDAFSQKFSNEPILIKGFNNLYAMEIDTKAPGDKLMAAVNDGTGIPEDEGAASSLQSMLKELTSAVPGIDECMGFAELMKQVQTMDYDCIVFDTAPTGHTLRLLSMPTVMENAFEKINELKDRFSGMSGLFGQMAGMMGGNMPSQDAMMGQMEAVRYVVVALVVFCLWLVGCYFFIFYLFFFFFSLCRLCVANFFSLFLLFSPCSISFFFFHHYHHYHHAARSYALSMHNFVIQQKQHLFVYVYQNFYQSMKQKD